ncbi:3-phosphoshikimate 1-carboxyvinyltransferase [Candidatus Pyrohabitans sp.]
MRAIIEGVQEVYGSVVAPPSKSYTHRAFVVSGLAGGSSRITNYLVSEDTLATIAGMRSFGVDIAEEGEGVALVRGSGGRLATPAGEVDCKNSGTTLRLLTGVAALDGEVILTGDASLQRRPVQPLLDALAMLGVSGESIPGNGCPPVKIEGGSLRGGVAKIRGDVSSQFISALLLVAPYAESDVEIVLTSPLKSKPYVDITIEIIRTFGAEVENRDYDSFCVTAGRIYRGRSYSIEGDYSSASYFLALAALAGGEVRVENLNPRSKQGDRAILEILRRMGASVKTGKDWVSVRGEGELKGIEVDLGDTPDLLPTVAALAVKARGKTVIKNVEHARYKESDRIATCSQEFVKFGAKIKERRDGMEIEGASPLRGAKVSSHGDHRLAMALSIAALSAIGKSVVQGVECASISFPGFFDELAKVVPRGSVEVKA